MNFQVFSIYDSKTLLYSPPYVCQTRGEAIRRLLDEKANANSSIARHPGDYELCHLGSYDPSLGVFELSAIVRLGNAEQLAQ